MSSVVNSAIYEGYTPQGIKLPSGKTYIWATKTHKILEELANLEDAFRQDCPFL